MDGEPVTWKGTHFQVQDVRISMPTVQRPRPPIWLAANGDAGVRRAATIADALADESAFHAGDAGASARLSSVALREASGRPSAAEIPVIKECLVAATKAAALAAARPFLESKYRAYQRWEQDKALPPGESFALDFEALARDRFVIGDPERGRRHPHPGIPAGRDDRHLPRAVAGPGAGCCAPDHPAAR